MPPPCSDQAVVLRSPFGRHALAQCSLCQWASQDSAWTLWFLYLKPISHTQLSHWPVNRGSKHLQNVSKLLPDYTMQHPKRQPSSAFK
jgi:hypothetical protein